VRQAGLDRLADWLMREEITIFHGGSFFHHVVGALNGSQQFPQMRLIYYGGEPLTRRDVELFQQHFSPHCILVNQLGSCEMKCFRRYFITNDSPLTGDIIPVGYAVEDTEVLLLDEAGQPVAAGEVGEIAVRTRYLAPAYWRRPDLTAAAFLPDPDGSDQRLYRTGDRGRLLRDSCLICLGRNDAQVKVRGHRVELAEIEAALQGLAPIKEAAVALRGEEPEAARLVAYLVAAGEEAPTVSSIRRALGERLPEYLIPSVYRF
jgi:non-ribosomal peptide synthetase component F